MLPVTRWHQPWHQRQTNNYTERCPSLTRKSLDPAPLGTISIRWQRRYRSCPDLNGVSRLRLHSTPATRDDTTPARRGFNSRCDGSTSLTRYIAGFSLPSTIALIKIQLRSSCLIITLPSWYLLVNSIDWRSVSLELSWSLISKLKIITLVVIIGLKHWSLRAGFIIWREAKEPLGCLSADLCLSFAWSTSLYGVWWWCSIRPACVNKAKRWSRLSGLGQWRRLMHCCHM